MEACLKHLCCLPPPHLGAAEEQGEEVRVHDERDVQRGQQRAKVGCGAEWGQDERGQGRVWPAAGRVQAGRRHGQTVACQAAQAAWWLRRIDG